MRRIFCSFVLIFFLKASFGQKKIFFDNYQIVPFLYFDDIYLKQTDWKDAFLPKDQPIYQFIDSFQEESRSYFKLKARGGLGIQFRLNKNLPVFKTSKRSILEWNIGSGYRYLRLSSDQFVHSPFNFQTDTAQIYSFEKASFRWTKHYIDAHNSITYNIYRKGGKTFAFVGFGLQSSFNFSSSIKESYQKLETNWVATPRRTWQTRTVADKKEKHSARKVQVHGIHIPIGIGFKISENSKLRLGIEYFRSFRNIQVQKETEGLIFNSTFQYKL